MTLPRIVGETWFNSKSLRPEELLNKVVLVDFWTYSCVNCQRTLPYLADWWKKYKEMGFLVVGIHTPEFEFEKDPKNVEQALRNFNVTWPVVLDNDRKNWNTFANHYWPAKYLADVTGRIVYEHFGEGACAETEKRIQELLYNKGQDAPIVSSEEHEHGSVCFIPTPELYCGYERNRLANKEGYQHDKIALYRPPEEMPQDSIALSGKFIARSEYVESAASDSTLFLRFRATEINLVLSSVSDETIIDVSVDNKPLGERLGDDVATNNEVVVKAPTLYNLLKSRELVEGVLALTAKKGAFRAYAFTFSGCTEQHYGIDTSD